MDILGLRDRIKSKLPNLVQKNCPDRTKFTHYSPERTGRLDIT